MKKFFSLVLALVMALSLTTMAWGAPLTALPADGDDGAVDNVITLAADVTLDTNATLTDTVILVPAGATVVLDLGGKTLTATGTGSVFDVKGNLTVKNGTIDSTRTTTVFYGNNGVADEVNDIYTSEANLTLTNVNVTTSGYIINSNGTISGWNSITVTGGEYNTSAGGFICDMAWACNVSMTGVKATSTSTTKALVEVGGWGYETATFTDCVFTSAGTGVMAYTIGASYGAQVTINGGTYVGTDIVVQTHETVWAGGPVPSVTINGGSFTGKLENAPTSTGEGKIVVNAGTFTDENVTDYLASGVSVKPDGTVAATASFSGTANITTKFSEDGTYYVLNASNVWEQVEYVPADDNGDGTGNVAYFEGTSGTTYIICKKNDDDALKLTSGFLAGDKLLNYVKVSEVEYEATATAVNASLYATCTTDINAKGYKVVDAYGAVTYYKDPATGVTPTNWLLVGKEIKGVVPQVEVTDYVMGGHALIQNRAAWLDEAETIHEYKCVICGTKFNGTTTKAAGVTYVPYFEPNAATKTAYTTAGYDMSDVDTGNLWLISTKVPTGGAATTDKVTSAETFDAGIAMYVGMSVMAAAGSAVVIGKKKD